MQRLNILYIHSKTIWSFRVSHKIGPRFEQVKGFLTQNFVTVKVRNFWNEYLGILVHPILHCSTYSCILSCIVQHTRASYPALFDILVHPILHCSTYSCILSCIVRHTRASYPALFDTLVHPILHVFCHAYCTSGTRDIQVENLHGTNVKTQSSLTFQNGDSTNMYTNRFHWSSRNRFYLKSRNFSGCRKARQTIAKFGSRLNL